MKKTITEFANERNQDRDTVGRWIRRHPEVDKCFFKDGKEKYIDTESEGYALLDKQYPYPKPIQIIEDTESREQLLRAQSFIIELQEQLREQTKKVALAETQQLLIETKEKEIQRLEESVLEKNLEKDALRTENERIKNELEEKERVLEEKDRELQEMKSRNLWQRIFNK